jgi:hypothetical protein
MIELIFALVIMGIVFLTLPLILIQNADSVEDNLIQESIFLSSSKMSQLLTFQWDENSKDPAVILSAADVLRVSATGDNELDRNASDFRRGHFREDKHRRMTPINNERSASAIGLEGAVYDDIDDFDGIVNFDIITAPDVGGYKKRYRADVNVTYVNDNTDYTADPVNFAFTTADAVNTTNLKMVETSIVQDRTGLGDWETSVLLRAYVANIGETGYFKRRYQ